MKNTISRNAYGKNDMNMKVIIAMLALGTSVLAVNAQTGRDTSETGSTTHDLRWSYSQSPQAQNTDASRNPNVGTYSPVPEARTIIAGALLLLPLGVSAVRGFRRNKKCADQNS
jgi:hypothetical protein